MRRSVWPFVAAALIAAVAIHWWPPSEGGYQFTGGTLLLVYPVRDLIASVVLLSVALAIIVRELAGWKTSRQ